MKTLNCNNFPDCSPYQMKNLSLYSAWIEFRQIPQAAEFSQNSAESNDYKAHCGIPQNPAKYLIMLNESLQGFTLNTRTNSYNISYLK